MRLTRRNHISMIPKKIDNERYFMEDMKMLIDYAKEKNIKTMHTKTHKILVLSFLKEYTKFSRKEIFEKISNLKINESIKIKADFGQIDITYVGKEINNCNRYNKNKKGLVAGLLEEKHTYKLVIHIN